MSYKTIALDKLVKADWNYKSDGEQAQATMEKLRYAMEKRGQIINLLVRPIEGEQFEVVNGNHRLEVLKDMGTTDAMCFDLGEISQSEAELIAIETNELEVEPDAMKLAESISRITKAFPIDELIKTLPYSKGSLGRMIAKTKVEPSEEKAPSMKKMVVLHLPKELGEQFKEQLDRFEDDARAIQICVECLQGHDVVKL